MMVIDNVYELEDFVYLKTDPEQFQRIVTGITIRKTSLIYELSLADRISGHYDFEIIKDKNVLIDV